MRVSFLGSPPFGTPILERLAHSEFAPKLVVTPPARARGRGRKETPQPLAERARELGLEVAQPRTVRDPEFMAQLEALDLDCILVASYGELLRQEFLDLPRLGCLNVHPSLLPRHRGATPIPAAILAGDAHTGVTIQRMVLKLDAGEILVAQEAPMIAGETAGEMTERLAELSGELAFEALGRLQLEDPGFEPQDDEAATYCKKLEKSDGLLDWTEKAEELERRVRAFHPWPGARTYLPNGKPLSVWRTHVVELAGEFEAGVVVSSENASPSTGALIVATGEGGLSLDEVQSAGKRAMSAEDFQRGARIEPGQSLLCEAPS